MVRFSPKKWRNRWLLQVLLIYFKKFVLWLCLIVLSLTLGIDKLLSFVVTKNFISTIYIFIDEFFISVQRMQVAFPKNITDFVIYTLLKLIINGLVMWIIERVISLSYFCRFGSSNHMSVHKARKCMDKLFNVYVGNCRTHEGSVKWSIQRLPFLDV